MEDWDTDYSNSGSQSNSGGFGSLAESRPARGRGFTALSSGSEPRFGRGKSLGYSNNESGFGARNSTMSNQFGDTENESGGGFGQNFDSHEEESSGGFGSNIGQYQSTKQSSGGFGEDSNGGFGSGFDRDNDTGSSSFGGSGGFGSSGGARRGGGNGGSRGCFKCGEEGHMSRECPNNAGDSRRQGCFKCGEEGHMSRDCTKDGGNTRSKGCFKCGEGGHMSRDCTKDSSGSRPKGCFKCGEEGHMSRDCTKEGGGNSRPKGCFKCGEEGHMSRDCTNESAGNSRPRGCFKCGEEGHMSRDCTNESAGNSRPRGCFKCGEEGHMSRDCTSEGSGNGRSKGCFKCGEEGHMSRECPNADNEKGGGTDADGKPREIYIPREIEDSELYEGMSTGINFDQYEHIPVSVHGNNAPNHIRTFEEAGLGDLLLGNIKKAGYTKPTPVQKYAIPVILQNRDMMACAQTGSGKTAAFVIPIIQNLLNSDLPSASFQETQEPLTVIMSPTRELANQIYKDARKFSLGSIVRCCVVYGGTSVGFQSTKLMSGCHILVATPGRLHDYVRRGKISFARLKFLVLDEADRMLNLGFLDSVKDVLNHSSTPPKSERQTLMFSATFPNEIRRLAEEFLEDYVHLSVGSGGANTDVTQEIYQVEKFKKRDKLMEILGDSVAEGEKVIVFVETKRNADFVASFMSQKGFPTTSIHGDRLQREREEALYDFIKGRMSVLVATSVAARGLDIPSVSVVINYDLPNSVDEYIHRIGRTGRVGHKGRSVAFFDPSSDQAQAQDLVKVLQEAQQTVPDWLIGGDSSSFGYDSTNAGGDDGWGNGGGSMGVYGGGFGNVGGLDSGAAVEESWD